MIPLPLYLQESLQERIFGKVVADKSNQSFTLCVNSKEGSAALTEGFMEASLGGQNMASGLSFLFDQIFKARIDLLSQLSMDDFPKYSRERECFFNYNTQLQKRENLDRFKGIALTVAGMREAFSRLAYGAFSNPQINSLAETLTGQLRPYLRRVKITALPVSQEIEAIGQFESPMHGALFLAIIANEILVKDTFSWYALPPFSSSFHAAFSAYVGFSIHVEEKEKMGTQYNWEKIRHDVGIEALESMVVELPQPWEDTGIPVTGVSRGIYPVRVSE